MIVRSTFYPSDQYFSTMGYNKSVWSYPEILVRIWTYVLTIRSYDFVR